MEGFGRIYEANISDQKKGDITAEKGTLEYWQQVAKAQKKNSKPKNSIAAAEQMVLAEKGEVPKLLRDVVEQARNLARSTG